MCHTIAVTQLGSVVFFALCVQVARVNTVDRFYPGEPGKPGRIRVTINPQGEPVLCIRKARLGNLDLSLVGSGAHFDIRLSASAEESVDTIPTGPYEYERRKSRVSYQFDIFRVDITEVFDIEPGKALDVKPTYEVEVEIVDLFPLSFETAPEDSIVATAFFNHLFNLARVASQFYIPSASSASSASLTGRRPVSPLSMTKGTVVFSATNTPDLTVNANVAAAIFAKPPAPVLPGAKRTTALTRCVCVARRAAGWVTRAHAQLPDDAYDIIAISG